MPRRSPLSETSYNNAGRKRPAQSDDDGVSVVSAGEWAAAVKKKKTKQPPPPHPSQPSAQSAIVNYFSGFPAPAYAPELEHQFGNGNCPGQGVLVPQSTPFQVSQPAALQPPMQLANYSSQYPQRVNTGYCPFPNCSSCSQSQPRPGLDWKHRKAVPAESVPEVQRPSLAPPAVCNCDNPANDSHGIVYCANTPKCKVGAYHKKCVGLGSRRDTPGWRCFDCRPKPPVASSTTMRISQPPPSLQQSQLSHSGGSTRKSSPPPAEPSKIINHGPAEPSLHPEQERIVESAEHGHNIFYTGSAGTGKSTVLKALVRRLKNQGKQVDIVAPSGIAALNVGGQTIYAYASWHPDVFKEGMEKLLQKSHGKGVRKRLGRTDVLIIDEISMVERDVFVRLDQIMRNIREGWKDWENPRKKLSSPRTRRLPFGGCQIIVTGDFCQLPPVKPFRFCIQCGGDELLGWNSQDGRILRCKKCPLTYTDQDKWAFRSDTWEFCKFTYFELKNIHRQNDKQFINILQKCRLGKELLPSEKELLTRPKADPIGAVKLLPRRNEVDNENQKNFNLLRGSPRGFECLDFFVWRNKDEPELQKKGTRKYPSREDGPLLALKDHRFEERVQLKVGMLVILLVNLDFPAGLVNGSQGKIVRFEKYDENKQLVPRPQERMAAVTRGGNTSETSTPNEYAEMKEEQIRQFISRAAVQEWPVVEFFNGETRPIYACCQLSELGSDRPFSTLGRTQIPLLPAWAITIHKSQGMTLDRVIVDLYSSFEREMCYVALSRARNLEGLKVVRLAKNMEAQGVNEEVHAFLKQHFGHVGVK